MTGPPEDVDVQQPGRGDDDGLGKRTMSGLRWTYAQSAISLTLQTIFTMVTGRLIADELFGIVAIGSLTIGFARFFAEMGMGPAIIQRDTVSDDEVRASFTSGFGLGLVVMTTIMLAAPWLVDTVFDNPELDRDLAVLVLRVFSISTLSLGFGITAQSLLRRELRFRELAIAETIAFAVGFGLVGLPLAFGGAGVWALVAANVTATVLGPTLKYLRVRHSLVPILRWAVYKPLYGFGLRMTGIQLLNFGTNQTDTFVVGASVTSSLLGQYNRAFYLVNLPMNYLTDALSRVLFPSFSRMQHDPERMRRVWTRMVGIAAVLLLPITTGIGVAAVDLVEVALGDKWAIAASIVPWLAAASSFRLLSRFAASAVQARGRLNGQLTMEAVYVAGLLGGMLAVAAGDAELWHFAAALAAGEALRHLGYLTLMRGTVRLGVRDVASIYLPALSVAAGVGLAMAGARAAVVGTTDHALALLAVEVVVAGLALLIMIRLGPVRTVRSELHGRVGRLARHRVVGPAIRAILGPPSVAAPATVPETAPNAAPDDATPPVGAGTRTDVHASSSRNAWASKSKGR